MADLTIITEPQQDKPQAAVPKKAKLDVYSGSLAVLSSNVGGGLVSMPWAFLKMGFPLATIVLVLFGVCSQISCFLLLEARKRVGHSVQTMFEVAYVCAESWGVFYVCLTCLLQSVFVDIALLVVFGETCASIFKRQSEVDHEWMQTRTPYILGFGLFLTVPCLMKQIKELKVVALSLFISIFILIGLFLYLLHRFGREYSPDEQVNEYFGFTMSLDVFIAIGVVSTAQSFQTTLFPIQKDLMERSLD